MKTPAWVYAASIGAGALAVFVPAIAPELVFHWEGSRSSFVAAAAVAVVAHSLLHAFFPRETRSKLAWALPTLAPALIVAVASLAVAAWDPAVGFSAFAANFGASGPDLYEAVVGPPKSSRVERPERVSSR